MLIFLDFGFRKFAVDILEHMLQRLDAVTITITITMRVFSAPLYTKPDREALQQS